MAAAAAATIAATILGITACIDRTVAAGAPVRKSATFVQEDLAHVTRRLDRCPVSPQGEVLELCEFT